MYEVGLQNHGLTIVVSDHAKSASAAFKAAGFVPFRIISTAKFAGPSGTELLATVASGLCRYIHIHTPLLKDLRPYEVAFWGQCSAFIQAATEARTLYAMHSVYHGDHTGSPHFHMFYERHVRCRKLHETKHRWCHWRIERDGRMSSNCVVLWTNFHIPGHPCNCPSGTKHQNLLAPSGVESDRYRLAVQFSTRLLASLASCMGLTSGSTSPPGLARRLHALESSEGSNALSPGHAVDLEPQRIPDSVGYDSGSKPEVVQPDNTKSPTCKYPRTQCSNQRS